MNVFNTLKAGSTKFIALIIMILGVGLQSNSIAQNSNTTTTMDYFIWNCLLQKHVNDNGEVDYIGFIKDKKLLYTFTDKLSKQK